MRFLIPAIMFCGLVFRLFAEPVAIPDYQVGDKATATIVSPVPLIVLDQQKTEQIRQQEAQRIQAVFRYYPQAVDEAESNLRTAFDAMHEKFLTLLQTNYNKRLLAPSLLGQPKFLRLTSSFPKQNKGFPLTTNLAETWAKDESDAVVQAEMVAKLRQAMSGYVRADNLPQTGKVGPWNAKVISLPAPGITLDPETVTRDGFSLSRTNFIPIGKVRKELASLYATNEQAVAKFVSSFVKENLVLDEDLTKLIRSRKTDALWAADHYDAGQVIISANEIVTARLKAALDQLREKTAVDVVKAEMAREKIKTLTSVARIREQALLAHSEAENAGQRNWWAAVAGGVLGIFMLLLALLRIRRRAASPTLLAAPLIPAQSSLSMLSMGGEGSMVVSHPPVAALAPSPDGDQWKERALEAERKAEQLHAVVKQGLFPQLSRWLAQKFVARLSAERRALLETQRAAELAIAQIEQRLIEVRAPLEERLKAYEERIQDLEQQLSEKTVQNQELIKATIAAARKKLEAERKGHLEFS